MYFRDSERVFLKICDRPFISHGEISSRIDTKDKHKQTCKITKLIRLFLMCHQFWSFGRLSPSILPVYFKLYSISGSPTTWFAFFSRMRTAIYSFSILSNFSFYDCGLQKKTVKGNTNTWACFRNRPKEISQNKNTESGEFPWISDKFKPNHHIKTNQRRPESHSRQGRMAASPRNHQKTRRRWGDFCWGHPEASGASRRLKCQKNSSDDSILISVSMYYTYIYIYITIYIISTFYVGLYCNMFGILGTSH